MITIEAKNALHDSSKDEFFQIEDIIGKYGAKKCLFTIIEDKEEGNVEQRAISTNEPSQRKPGCS